MKNIKSYFSHYRGFTLSELLAVVVILSILAIMATGSFRLAIEKAHFTEGLQAAEKVAAALERFYYENPSLPYEERIYPSMEQLDLSFSDMGPCTAVTKGTYTFEAAEEFVNEYGDEDHFFGGSSYIDAARAYESRCRRIGKFEIGLVRDQRGCATIVTAIRGGSRLLNWTIEEKGTLLGHTFYEYRIDFGFAEQATSDNRFKYNDYIISVYPSFFDGAVGLRKCLAPYSDWHVHFGERDWLFRKKVSCTGLERLCASLGFTENPNPLPAYEHAGVKSYVSSWFRP